MDNYIVSARKYRPANFRSVIGQKSLTTTLKNAILNNKLAHAYLFCGPRGVGKTTCARIFAKSINCFNPTPEGEACNECESCRSFNENRSYNIHELDAASNNGVDDIRQLTEQVRIPPQIGKYKVYIIDEVHMLSTAAFNAFLKTLEEPPRYAIFILATTEKHKLLPTILSRCQIYDFNRIHINDIVEYLEYVAGKEGVTVEREALNVVAQKADGGMRDALSIFDQVVSFAQGNVTYKSVIENLNVLDYEYYFRLTEYILQGQVGNCLLLLNEILSKGFDGQHIITGLASFFRDVLVCRDPQTIMLFEVGDAVKEKYLQVAQLCPDVFLYKAIDLSNECDLNYRISRNKRLLMELLLIRLCRLNQSSDPEDDKKKTIIDPIVDSPAPEKTSVATSVPTDEPKAAAVSLPQDILLGLQKDDTSTGNAKIKPVSIGVKKTGKEESEKEEKNPPRDENVVMNDAFSQEDLVNAWKMYAEKEDDIHLKNTMVNFALRLKENNVIEIGVPNPIQQAKLNEKVADLYHFLSSQLRNSSIRIEIKITEDDSRPQLFTDQEKFKDMATRNSNLVALVDEFNLRLD
ncbi:MAG: DNA polymerase III subunit gamma/tau [Dysgonamonadaceae bacterium]|jgi:DNA polymerase-3 subunit gamma/tau|nr:DNA polymerase III subunit gamma/tau [Dysgonamonadaceae bacterium]